MRLKRILLDISLIIFIIFVLSGVLNAQDEVRLKLPEKDTSKLKATNFVNRISITGFSGFNPSHNVTSNFTNDVIINRSIFVEPNSPISSVRFNQQRTDSDLTGLGKSQWYNNQLFIKAGEKVTLGIEGGLAIQNSVLDPFIPNYQYTMGITFEYVFNDRLKAYIFGRYISKPLNKSDDYFDPFMYNNHLFLQSGTGIGLQSNVKNTLIDFQIMSGYDQQLENMNNINSKLKIKF